MSGTRGTRRWPPITIHRPHVTLTFYAALRNFPELGRADVRPAPKRHLARQTENIPVLRSYEGPATPAETELREYRKGVASTLDAPVSGRRRGRSRAGATEPAYALL